MEDIQLARRIRAYRKLKGYTQTELAEKIGVSTSVLGAVERGNRRAEMAMVEKLCEVLCIDKSELLSNR
ncbi:helix-turn-helix domain-containing protein [Marinicrinis lubricantis]|uniref:Helix-turn-helix domain-containing protein n=1 Tax=Marinicrinis lubricantis TaxID=2086470 RepID=A0ABW1IPS7_9BACL